MAEPINVAERWPIDEMLDRSGGKPREAAVVVWALIGYLATACAWILVYVFGRTGSDSLRYLLSATAQVAAAVLAITITVPLAFQAGAKYVYGAVGYVVRSKVLVGYALLFLMAIVTALLALVAKHPSRTLALLAVSLTGSSLASTVPFLRWVAASFETAAFVDEMLLPAYGRIMKAVESGGQMSDWEPQLRLTFERALTSAAEAARDGAYVPFVKHISFVLAAAVKKEPATRTRQSELAWVYLLSFTREFDGNTHVSRWISRLVRDLHLRCPKDAHSMSLIRTTEVTQILSATLCHNKDKETVLESLTALFTLGIIAQTVMSNDEALREFAVAAHEVYAGTGVTDVDVNTALSNASKVVAARYGSDPGSLESVGQHFRDLRRQPIK